jgi:uncharacterized protein (TIGR02996 family)
MEEAALLAAIAAHPEEDTPRLAYADWLDEHAGGLPDPDAARIRAEFIRVQCELKKYEHLPSSQQQGYADLYRRQDAILTRHRRDLLGPLGEELTAVEMTRDVVFDRGFLKKLTLDAERFFKNADAIAVLKPLPEVSVVQAGARAGQLLDCPHVGIISVLHMESTQLDPSEVNPLSPRRTQWSRLRELNLAGCRIGDLGLRGLASSPGYPVLTDLDLSYNEISDEGVRLLVASPLWPRLTRLVFGGNPISDEGASVLADAAGTSRLKELNLRFTGITTDGHRVLLRKFPRRTKLDLF